MAGSPQVLGLLEEMLDAGKTHAEVCRDCPELLPEGRRRWQEFRLIDAQVGELLPGLGPSSAPGTRPERFMAGSPRMRSSRIVGSLISRGPKRSCTRRTGSY